MKGKVFLLGLCFLATTSAFGVQLGNSFDAPFGLGGLNYNGGFDVRGPSIPSPFDIMNQIASDLRQNIQQAVSNTIQQFVSPLKQLVEQGRDMFNNIPQSILSNLPNGDALGQFVANFSASGNLPNLGDLANAVQNAVPKIDPSQIANGLPNAGDLVNAVPKIDPSQIANGLQNFDWQKVLSDVQSNLQNRSQDIRNIINGLPNVQNLVSDMKANIKKAIDDARDNFNKNLASFSPALSKCISQNGSPFDAGLNAAMKTAQGCVQDKAGQALSLLQKVQSDFASAGQNVDTIRNALAECRLNISLSLGAAPQFNSSQANCLALAILKIDPSTIALPVSLASDAATAAAMVSNIKGDIIQCQAKVGTSVFTEVTGSSLNLARCVAENPLALPSPPALPQLPNFFG